MSVIKALSSQRLASYRRAPQETEEQVIHRYLWNVALSEALYPTLHTLEVTLRNYVYDAIRVSFGDRWLWDGRRIQPREQDAIRKAEETLTKQSKPVDIGNVIAELNFGFWTSLFDRRYEQIFWPAHLKPAFPTMPRTDRTRHTVSARLNKIRKLRNRVFHYEPIWHWGDLAAQHSEILETIGWMSPEIVTVIGQIDRFSGVHATMVQPP